MRSTRCFCLSFRVISTNSTDSLTTRIFYENIRRMPRYVCTFVFSIYRILFLFELSSVSVQEYEYMFIHIAIFMRIYIIICLNQLTQLYSIPQKTSNDTNEYDESKLTASTAKLWLSEHTSRQLLSERESDRGRENFCFYFDLVRQVGCHAWESSNRVRERERRDEESECLTAALLWRFIAKDFARHFHLSRVYLISFLLLSFYFYLVGSSND